MFFVGRCCVFIICSLVVVCLPFVVRWLLVFVVRCLLFVVCCLLRVVCLLACLLFVVVGWLLFETVCK